MAERSWMTIVLASSVARIVYLVLLFTFYLSQICSATTSFAYLGCYADSATSRDLSGPAVSLLDNNVTAESCLTGCQTQGFPYGGLQMGNGECYCGMSYGSYGPGLTGCKMVCGDNLPCGDTLDNSVYYTVDVSDATISQQSVQFQQLSQPFNLARMSCVSNQGDLMSINVSQVNQTMDLITQASSSVTKVWIGMMYNSSSLQYQWIDPAVLPYDSSAPDALQWKPEQVMSPCVLFDAATGLLESAPCSVPFAYLCMSIPLPPTTTYRPIIPNPGDSMLVYYIILPLFLFCYLGSCSVYTVYRIVRGCRGIPVKHKRLDDHHHHHHHYPSIHQASNDMDTEMGEGSFGPSVAAGLATGRTVGRVQSSVGRPLDATQALEKKYPMTNVREEMEDDM